MTVESRKCSVITKERSDCGTLSTKCEEVLLGCDPRPLGRLCLP